MFENGLNHCSCYLRQHDEERKTRSGSNGKLMGYPQVYCKEIKNPHLWHLTGCHRSKNQMYTKVDADSLWLSRPKAEVFQPLLSPPFSPFSSFFPHFFPTLNCIEDHFLEHGHAVSEFWCYYVRPPWYKSLHNSSIHHFNSFCLAKACMWWPCLSVASGYGIRLLLMLFSQSRLDRSPCDELQI